MCGLLVCSPLDARGLSSKIDSLSEELGVSPYFKPSVLIVFRFFNYLRRPKAAGTLVASSYREEGQS